MVANISPLADGESSVKREGRRGFEPTEQVAGLPAYEDFHTNQLAALPSVAAVTSFVTMKTLSPVTS
jgi:hypothetical protein